MQYWEGDRAHAEAVVKLLARLEPEHREDTDILLVARYDCKVDPRVVHAASAKFNTFSYTCPRREIGWPSGCNALWQGTLDYVRQMMGCKRMPRYDAILTFEADAVPLVPDWLDRLHRDWKEAGCFVAGALIRGDEHINGNALFSTSPFFLEAILKRKVPVGIGWDRYLYSIFKSFGRKDLPGFRSHWQRQTVGAEELERLLTEGVYFYHGVKDASVIEFVQKKYLTRPKKLEPL
jgi:hypothetical protein